MAAGFLIFLGLLLLQFLLNKWGNRSDAKPTANERVRQQQFQIPIKEEKIKHDINLEKKSGHGVAGAILIAIVLAMIFFLFAPSSYSIVGVGVLLNLIGILVGAAFIWLLYVAIRALNDKK